MFLHQCGDCGERWYIGNPRTCKCPDETPQRTEQEPDVIMHWESHTWTTNNPPPNGSGDVGLYYAPPQRTWVGLTDEEKNDCLVSADPCETLAEPEARQLIEDVEQALKEKNSV